MLKDKKKKKPRVSLGINTIQSCTLDEWTKIWLDHNILPWKDEYKSSEFSYIIKYIEKWFKNGA